MSDDLRAVLVAAVEETVQLRSTVVVPGAYAFTSELLDSVLDVRVRLDRVEELLGNVLRVRAEAKRQHSVVAFAYEQAWDEAAVRARQSSVRDEYTSARERTAATNLEVLDLRRAERAADDDARRCDEAVEFVRLRHRGLADFRQDIIAIIKARQFESSLDR